MIWILLSFAALASSPSEPAQKIAEYAASKYGDKMIQTLEQLVSFPTVHKEGTVNYKQKPFRDMSRFLKKFSRVQGFDFKQYGDVVVIGYGKEDDRLGVITHGDVQPADPEKWKKSPFVLDRSSEPGRLIGRGTEDDKGAIATTLYAMKAIQDQKLALDRRIELIISYTEESNWKPFKKFLKNHTPPEINVAVDASYPVTVAEKGWSSIHFGVPLGIRPAKKSKHPWIESFSGGSFMSQVPEDAVAVIAQPDQKTLQAIADAAGRFPAVQFTFIKKNKKVRIVARGRAAHSSQPENGLNAIAYLAEVLSTQSWPESTASLMVRFIHDRIGLGHYGKRFGKIAYRHEFMGPLTVNLSLVKAKAGKLVAGINLRRPLGKDKDDLRKEIEAAIRSWQKPIPSVAQEKAKIYIGRPKYNKDAPHVETLLGIFSHYTGIQNPEPISIGGGTHGGIVPNGVNFGPSMPGVPYSGHSEHEFLTEKQFRLNLKMYTAMLVELAGD